MKPKKNTVIRNPKVAWQNIQEKVVVVSPETMRIHVLHGSGGSIWEYLKQSRSPDELAGLLCEEYDTTADTAKHDVNEFLDKLKKEDLVLAGA